jgi:hypothetical protein
LTTSFLRLAGFADVAPILKLPPVGVSEGVPPTGGMPNIPVDTVSCDDVEPKPEDTVGCDDVDPKPKGVAATPNEDVWPSIPDDVNPKPGVAPSPELIGPPNGAEAPSDPELGNVPPNVDDDVADAIPPNGMDGALPPNGPGIDIAGGKPIPAVVDIVGADKLDASPEL